MAGKGGAIPGNGRKSDAERWKSRTKALNALIAKYGSEEAAWEEAIKDPMLKKFVYEHAFGKPQDVVDITSDDEPIRSYHLEIVRTNVKSESEN